MSYCVNIMINGSIHQAGDEDFANLYDACGQAAMLVSGLKAGCSLDAGTTISSLTVDVLSDGGDLVMRFPIDFHLGQLMVREC